MKSLLVASMINYWVLVDLSAKRGFFLKTEENASVLKCFACGFREFAPLSFGWQNQFELHDNANPSCPLLGNWSNNVALLPDEEEALLN